MLVFVGRLRPGARATCVCVCVPSGMSFTAPPMAAQIYKAHCPIPSKAYLKAAGYLGEYPSHLLHGATVHSRKATEKLRIMSEKLKKNSM